MLEWICGHHCRGALIALALPLLGACAEPSGALLGQVEVRGAPARGGACEAPGELQLAGIDGRAALVVPGAELCSGVARRHALPPGLYTLTWRGAERNDLREPAEPAGAQGPTLLSLFTGQLTRVFVQLEPERSGSGMLDSNQQSTARAEAEGACSHHPTGAGAS